MRATPSFGVLLMCHTIIKYLESRRNGQLPVFFGLRPSQGRDIFPTLDLLLTQHNSWRVTRF